MNTPVETDRWNSLFKARRHVIACAAVIEEMQSWLPGEISREALDFGLHLRPEKLREALQVKIDEAGQGAEVLLLGYGLCSMAVIGLQARNSHLVIPRVDDCIAIFLGSCAAYKEQAKKEPGTYYLTKGWIEVGDTPFEEHQQLVKRYGEEKARRMTQLMLKNYRRLALINTGQYEIKRFREYARKTAQAFDLRFEEIDGSLAIAQKMVNGPWDNDFLVVAPGETVKYADFVQTRP